MTRNAVIVALICALAGALFHSWKSENDVRIAKQKETQALNEAKGTVFYALRDIPAGAEITRDAFKQSEELQSRIPQNSVDSLSRVIGRNAKYGLSAGQLLSYHDLVPNPKAVAMYANRDIPKGAIITGHDVAHMQCDELEPPIEGFASADYLVGKKAKRDIGRGSQIVDQDVERVDSP